MGKNSKLLDRRNVLGCAYKQGQKSIRVDLSNGKVKYIPNTKANFDKIRQISNYTEYDKKTKRRIWF